MFATCSRYSVSWGVTEMQFFLSNKLYPFYGSEWPRGRRKSSSWSGGGRWSVSNPYTVR